MSQRKLSAVERWFLNDLRLALPGFRLHRTTLAAAIRRLTAAGWTLVPPKGWTPIGPTEDA